ncbi:RNA methyltransferase [Halorussus salilacus]|uniref:RNA methyltransferase n=1 Tax=Halorussus salilacus TaxID=2953750 RepID=UPI0020A13359|nr:RNA methyltransferase [Halorussus salilacus]USZ68570.1 RNA methyltransferase [Halorussus salilacus]
MKPAVAVVEPKTPGNIGTIARAMKNFGMHDLKLVDPPEFGRDSEAYGYAGQAREDVLPNYDEVTFDELVANYHTVGCTATTNEDARKHRRFPFKTPAELADSLRDVRADTVLIFGREDNGLTNDEMARVDEVCSIPASADYSSLNLGQAATVTLYELRELTVEETQHPDVARERADEAEIEGLYDHFGEFLDAVDHPPEKREKTLRLARRLVGRAHPTGREVRTLRGVLRRAMYHAEDD